MSECPEVDSQMSIEIRKAEHRFQLDFSKKWTESIRSLSNKIYIETRLALTAFTTAPSASA